MSSDFPDLNKVVEKAWKKVASPRKLKKHGETMAKTMKARTRLGKGIGLAGKMGKLKSLSLLYIEYRKMLAKKGKLHPHTKPNKSNLTLTGQLLNSIRGGSKRFGEIMISILPDRRGGKPDNHDIVKFQEEQGRKFFDVLHTERNLLQSDIRNDLADEIDQELKKL